MQQSLNLSIGEIVDFPGDILTNSRIRIRNQLIDGCGIQRVCKSVDCRAADIRAVIVEQERDIFFPYQLTLPWLKPRDSCELGLLALGR